MKKEQLQRLILLVIFIVMGLYFFVEFMLAPLAKREKKAESAIKQLTPQIQEAKMRINRTRSIKEGDAHAEAAGVIFKVMEETIPREAAVAWFPQRMTEHFRQHGIGRPTSRPLPDQKREVVIGDYVTSSWTLSFDSVPFVKFGEALAGLENCEGLLQISTLRLDSSASNVENQRASLEITTIVKP